MENEANAEVQVYLSKDQQRALAMYDDKISEETCLTKGDKAPPSAPSDNLSDMTGSTRESKAKRYAAAEVQNVTQQYMGTISTMQGDVAQKDDKITKLELQLLQMADNANIISEPHVLTIDSDESIGSTPSDHNEPMSGSDSLSRESKRTADNISPEESAL